VYNPHLCCRACKILRGVLAGYEETESVQFVFENNNGTKLFLSRWTLSMFSLVDRYGRVLLIVFILLVRARFRLMLSRDLSMLMLYAPGIFFRTACDVRRAEVASKLFYGTRTRLEHRICSGTLLRDYYLL